jgi:hypothetical protein
MQNNPRARRIFGQKAASLLKMLHGCCRNICSGCFSQRGQVFFALVIIFHAHEKVDEYMLK